MKVSWLVVVGLCGLLAAGSAWAPIFNSEGVPIEDFKDSPIDFREIAKGHRKAAEKGDVEAYPNNDLALLNTGQGTTAIANFREGGGWANR